MATGSVAGYADRAGESMKLRFFILMAILSACRGAMPSTNEELARDLDRIAEVATVMVDGDVCQRIVTDRALAFMLHNSSRDKWADADNYDVDEAAFTQTKKTLIRLSHLVDYPVDVNLWMPPGSDPSLIHVVIRNRYEMSQFWPWGKLVQPVPDPMKTVLRTGERKTIVGKRGYVSVLAPVRNSLGDIAGLVEIVTRLEPDARENVK
jgi:hypothetical protein